ncbi:MAG TPA: hypothetical protein VEB40_09440 [Flavipsychrobacter sp.]|nr:hypothetical protein [Flavipsychrobacter sp.]
MWVKITSIEQLERLHAGSLIAIHPLQGAPTETFDDSDPDQVSHRLVAENDTRDKMILTAPLQRKEEARTVTSARMGNLMLGDGHIDYADILEHGTWWIQQGI